MYADEKKNRSAFLLRTSPINLEQADDMRINSIAKSYHVLCVNKMCGGDMWEMERNQWCLFYSEACVDDIVVVVVVILAATVLYINISLLFFLSPKWKKRATVINKFIEFMTIAPTNFINWIEFRRRVKKYEFFGRRICIWIAQIKKKIRKKYISEALSQRVYFFANWFT